MGSQGSDPVSGRRNASRRWTPSEDSILRKAMEASGDEPINWVGVSESLPGRSNKDTRRRWTKIKADYKKGVWSREEDNALRRAVEHFGQRWALVTEIVETRSPDQCQKRWRNALDPKIDVAPWSSEDDALLLEAVSEMSTNWSQICDHYFPWRSPLCLSNRYAAINSQSSSSAAKTGATETRSSTVATHITIPTPASIDPPPESSAVDQTLEKSWNPTPTPQQDELSYPRTTESFSDWLNLGSDATVAHTTDFETELAAFAQPNLSQFQTHMPRLDCSSGASEDQAVCTIDPDLNNVPKPLDLVCPPRDVMKEPQQQQQQQHHPAVTTSLVLENLDEKTRDEILRLLWSRKSHATLRFGESL